MQSHPFPDKIQFTAGATNVNVGEQADVVILLGPDNQNDTSLQKQFVEVQAYCESKNIKYVILGDGKKPVLKEDIAKLPRAEYVIINGHGNIGKDSKGETAHIISITSRADCTLDLMHEVQQKTEANRFLCCACYGGRINEDIKLKGMMNVDTEIITTSSIDEVSALKYSHTCVKNLLAKIAGSTNKKVPMSGYFGNLLKACPETMTYGKQLKDSFQTFTVRRQDRAILGEGDPQKYFKYNKKRLNEFLRANHLPVYKIAKMTDVEALNYRQTTFLHHVWHCDAEAVEKLIHIDPDIMKNLPQSPLNFALKIHSIHGLMKKNRDQIKRLLSVLIPHDPQGLSNYMRSVNTLNPNNAAAFNSVKVLLFEIATETQSPHVISELCTATQNELTFSMANLANAQIQLHQIQLLQDPAFMQQRHLQATALLQQAQLQTTIAKELFELIKSKLQSNEQYLISQAAANAPQPTQAELTTEAKRLTRLVESELKHLPVVIANIDKFSSNNEVENAAFSKTSAEKRIKDVMAYLIKLKLLGSPVVEKYTARLNALTARLQETHAQKDNLAPRQGLVK